MLVSNETSSDEFHVLVWAGPFTRRFLHLWVVPLFAQAEPGARVQELVKFELCFPKPDLDPYGLPLSV